MDELSIRDELEAITKELNINRDEFQEVDKTQWLDILNKTADCFIQNQQHQNNLHQGWRFFKEPKYSLRYINDDGYKYITNIIDELKVWFIVEDRNEKLWVYEVNKNIVSKVIAKSMQLREYYLVSKSFEWVLCENQQGVLHGSGIKIVFAMRSFRELYSEKIY